MTPGPAAVTEPAPTRSAFKDQVGGELVERLAEAFRAADPDFDSQRFTALAVTGLEPLELKARIRHIATALGHCLPEDFTAAAQTVTSVVSAVEDGRSELGGWDLWPVTDWVALTGRSEPGRALEVLGRLTRHATAEFAIRPFLDAEPSLVLARLHAWTGSPDDHLRRLVSEGTRPRLPWAPRLDLTRVDPGFAVPLLDRLRDDPSPYVRRSVANHLNDLCRIDRSLGLAVAHRWCSAAVAGPTAATTAEQGSLSPELEALLRHGLRSLVKAGDPAALRLLGHDPDAAVAVRAFRVDPVVLRLGEVLELTLDLESADPERQVLVVDYAVHFLTARGGVRRTVFRWSRAELDPAGRRRLVHRQRISPTTTRSHRAGEHVVEVMVNGRVAGRAFFDLELPGPG